MRRRFGERRARGREQNKAQGR
uniref:Uncharacterized protein n=1 Tax=Arundo donax TaxID=35708 RepID=A0A0A8Y2A2_ARUDO